MGISITSFSKKIFFLVGKDDPSQNKNGFVRYVPELFQKGIDILESQNLDYLKLSIIEFYGGLLSRLGIQKCARRQERVILSREKMVTQIKWKTKMDCWRFGLGWSFHVDNWPHIISKKGNYQMYLADPMLP